MSFILNIKGESDCWQITNRGAAALSELLGNSKMSKELAREFEISTYINGLYIDLQNDEDFAMAEAILEAINPVHLDGVDSDMQERYKELRLLLTKTLSSYPSSKPTQ
jgi:hypothetical protein